MSLTLLFYIHKETRLMLMSTYIRIFRSTLKILALNLYSYAHMDASLIYTTAYIRIKLIWPKKQSSTILKNKTKILI